MKMSGRLFEKHPGRYLHNTQPNVLNLRPGVSNFFKKRFHMIWNNVRWWNKWDNDSRQRLEGVVWADVFSMDYAVTAKTSLDSN